MTSLTGQQEAVAENIFPAHDVDAVVFYGDPTRIYKARRRSDGMPVMLKTLQGERSAREAAALLKHEYEMARRLNVPSVIRVFALEWHNNMPTIELEDFGGDSLNNITSQRRIPIQELLNIAVQLTQGLIDIHAANIIHKDINPSNIVYNPESGITKIIDFGISTHLTREQAALSSPEKFEGSLPYISPEQTGRMNRSIDYRTDFYSLGVTLYELLTGRPLFIVSEPIEWFHCHIAKQPKPPADFEPSIPRPLSELVMKLLAKTAEDRYQSAQGIKADLQHCLDEFTRTGSIAPFALARKDVSDRLQIPQRLYGRDNEVAQMLNNFKSASQGQCRVILVSGYSGIGKTCLVKEIYKPITERRGHFVTGKFDQLHRNLPYSALAAAFNDLVRQLLTKPESSLAQWRDKILDAVGANGQLLVDIIQELELVIGAQPAVPKIPPVEAEQRFHRVFLRFIQVFCGQNHPLVIFLDDLQWADSASMNLLDLLCSGESGITHLLIISAYRSNDVPVALWLKSLRARKAPLEEIHLRPLSNDHLVELLTDTFGVDQATAAPLSEVIMEKTAGNPFFIEEFLKTLHQEELIGFSRTEDRWTWDIDCIRTQQITDNVVDLMSAKLKRLAYETRRLLELGACIGFQFSLNELAIISELTPAEAARKLGPGIDAGLIAPIGDAYHFLELEQHPDTTEVTVVLAFAHDRIHQAAYALLSDARRQETHLRIGRLLFGRLSPDRQADHLFEIVNHLNIGSALIDDPTEQAELCRLNQTAGKRAKNANAYHPAFDYFQQGIALLAKDAWQQNYQVTLTLYEQAAEAAYLTGNYDRMDELLTTGLDRAKTLLDKINLYRVQISACMARGQLREAIKIALPVKRQLGHAYPQNPNNLHILGKLIKLKLLLRGKSMDDLRRLPVMTDPRHLAADRIGAQIGGAAMFAKPLLLPLMVVSAVGTAVTHGLNEISVTSFAAYGMILAESFGQVDKGAAFGRLALDLLDRPELRALEGRVHHIYNTFVRHWGEPIHNCIEPLNKAFRICLENGDFEYACHAICVQKACAFEAGVDLNQIAVEIRECLQMMKPLKQGPRLHYLSCYLQKVENLLGNTDDPVKLKGRHYNISEMMPQHVASGDKSLVYTDLFNQMYLYYLFGHYPEALRMINRSRRSRGNLQGMYNGVIATFYMALTQLANIALADKKNARKLRRRLSKNMARINRWAKGSPANAMNKLRLVQAEMLRVNGRALEAHPLYDESIQLAGKKGFIHEEALANELCGLMLTAAGRSAVADTYLARARDLYDDWGARAKVDQLHLKFPQLVERVGARRQTSSTTAWGTPHSTVDIGLLIKALKAIAEETVHSRMVETIINTAMEFAGAQEGMLLLRNTDGTLCIEAEACVDRGDPSILQSTPVAGANLAHAVVNYVSRSRSSVVIHDAQQPNNQVPGLNNDPYIQSHGVRSLLCLPILAENHEDDCLIGMLYLENNRATAAFTQERFDTLEIICLSAAGRLELSRKAIVDGLTQLYNHDYFQNILSKEFASAQRHGHQLSMILIDIDHFKKFNDTWGHQVGDQVLREVSRIIKNTCRSGDTVARYGGEEMAVILPMTGMEKAKIVAERIRVSVEEHRVPHKDGQLQVTISLGLATMNAMTCADSTDLIRLADKALYRSKAEGRNKVSTVA